MSMKAQTQAWIAFAALLVGLAVAAGGWWLATSQHVMVYELRSTDSVSGLIPGAPVEFHGVEVGKVRQVRLAGPRQVRILIEVDRQAPVSSATVATITSRGLATRGFTGYVYVALDDGGTPGRPLRPAQGQRYAEIATAPSQGSNLDVSIRQLDQSVQTAVAMLQSVFDAQTVASLKQSARNLDQVSRTLAANTARIDALLAQSERASARMGPLLDAGRDTLSALRTELLPQAQATLADVDALTARSGQILQAVQDGLLPQAQGSLQRVDRLAASMEQTTTRIRRNPGLLLRAAPTQPPGPGEAP